MSAETNVNATRTSVGTGTKQDVAERRRKEERRLMDAHGITWPQRGILIFVQDDPER